MNEKDLELLNSKKKFNSKNLQIDKYLTKNFGEKLSKEKIIKKLENNQKEMQETLVNKPYIKEICSSSNKNESEIWSSEEDLSSSELNRYPSNSNSNSVNIDEQSKGNENDSFHFYNLPQNTQKLKLNFFQEREKFQFLNFLNQDSSKSKENSINLFTKLNPFLKRNLKFEFDDEFLSLLPESPLKKKIKKSQKIIEKESNTSYSTIKTVRNEEEKYESSFLNSDSCISSSNISEDSRASPELLKKLRENKINSKFEKENVRTIELISLKIIFGENVEKNEWFYNENLVFLLVKDAIFSKNKEIKIFEGLLYNPKLQIKLINLIKILFLCFNNEFNDNLKIIFINLPNKINKGTIFINICRILTSILNHNCANRLIFDKKISDKLYIFNFLSNIHKIFIEQVDENSLFDLFIEKINGFYKKEKYFDCLNEFISLINFRIPINFNINVQKNFKTIKMLLEFYFSNDLLRQNKSDIKHIIDLIYKNNKNIIDLLIENLNDLYFNDFFKNIQILLNIFSSDKFFISNFLSYFSKFYNDEIKEKYINSIKNNVSFLKFLLKKEVLISLSPEFLNKNEKLIKIFKNLFGIMNRFYNYEHNLEINSDDFLERTEDFFNIIEPFINLFFNCYLYVFNKERPIEKNEKSEEIKFNKPKISFRKMSVEKEEKKEKLFCHFSSQTLLELNHDFVQSFEKIIKYYFTKNENNAQYMDILCRNSDLRNKLDYEMKVMFIRSEVNKLANSSLDNLSDSFYLKIDRKNVFQDCFNYILRAPLPEFIHKNFYITFNCEEGSDQGGLTKEFLTCLSKEIFDPNKGLFEYSETEDAFKPNPISACIPDFMSIFKFLGMMMGKVILDNLFMEMKLTKSFIKQILGQNLNVYDYQSFDPEFVSNLLSLMDYNVKDLELTFSYDLNCFGALKFIDLIPNGREIQVTEENKEEFIEKMCFFKMSGSILTQIDAFKKGLELIIPNKTNCLSSLFNWREIQIKMSGIQKINIQEMKRYTIYEGYTEKSKIITWFWDILFEFDDYMIGSFIFFISGSYKIPYGGFKEFKFQINKVYEKDRLPISHTCFNSLDIPEYENFEILKEKLMKSIIEGNEGFGLG